MAMTYDNFKSFVYDFVWRQNDTDLANNMDNIIRMANAELNRKLDIQAREKAAILTPNNENPDLPDDFYQLISLSNLQPERQRKGGEMRLTSKSHIYDLRERTNSMYIEPVYYVTRGENLGGFLYLVGPFSASNPGSFNLTYREGVPDYQTTDSSWLEDNYLDLYLYTILKHVGVFLREEERINFYANLMQDALVSALDEDKRKVQFGGSPLNMKPVRHVPRTRRP
jgi:hypothetical protein